MDNLLQSVTTPAIKQLLLSRLQAVLVLYIPDALVLTQLRHISLHQAKDFSRVLYVSGLAFQLSQVKNIPALEIASALSSKLVVDITTLVGGAAKSSGAGTDEAECCWRKKPVAANLFQEFTVQVVPPGWIRLEVTEPTIAAWLQRLVSSPQLQNTSKEEHRFTRNDTSRLFAVQYAHARCCSLLQMAHREKLITLKASNTSRAVFLTVAPDPIPWLNSDQIRCCHLAERALIAQLARTLDDLYCPCNSRQPIEWEKAGLSLSQAFQSFYSCCRIWGEVKIQTLELAQVRLGLVMATQVVLRLLLQDKLGVPAPLEL